MDVSQRAVILEFNVVELRAEPSLNNTSKILRFFIYVVYDRELERSSISTCSSPVIECDVIIAPVLYVEGGTLPDKSTQRKDLARGLKVHSYKKGLQAPSKLHLMLTYRFVAQLLYRWW